MGRTIQRNDREIEFLQLQRLCGKLDRRRNAQNRGKVRQADLRICILESLLVRISRV